MRPKIGKALPKIRLLLGRLERWQFHQHQRPDDREKAQSVDEKAGGGAPAHQRDSRQHRAEHASEIEAEGVEGNRVGQCGAIVDHVGDEGLLSRHRESVHRPGECRDDCYHPSLRRNDPAPSQARQHERENHRGDLSPDKRRAPWVAIRNLSAIEGKQNEGDGVCAVDDSEPLGGFGQAPDEPSQSHCLHPRTGDRDRLSVEEEPGNSGTASHRTARPEAIRAWPASPRRLPAASFHWCVAALDSWKEGFPATPPSLRSERRSRDLVPNSYS